ncbi:MAG TPA: DinB family protein [Vicinamibacteria bacterium]|nr:DinB family protein [Vicinamibacteria bacterium]
MKIADLFAAQLDREAVVTRRALERVPEGRPDWKPHEKSMPLGYLSTLVATMPSWIAMMLTQDELDLNPPGGSAQRPPAPATNRELLQALDQSVAEARAALAKTTEEHLMTTWRLLVAGRTVAENPRHVMIADAFTHLAHHRGQLTVYLRLNGVPVPSIYGPTADDRSFG